MLTLAIEALRAAGLEKFSVQIGDASLFAGLIDALDIPAAWQARLKRHFRRPQSFAHLLQRLGSADAAAGAAWLSHVGRLSEEEARNSLSGLLELLGGTASREVIAGRTREEIVDRLMEQAADAASRQLPKNALAVIEAALAISGPAEKSVASLAIVLKRHGVVLETQLSALNARIAVLAKLGFAGEQVNFAPRFGRNLDYYTGFVFELWARDADGPVQVAGGGRYDMLLKTLGAAADIPAVGCAIRDERVLAARQFQRARGGREGPHANAGLRGSAVARGPGGFEGAFGGEQPCHLLCDGREKLGRRNPAGDERGDPPEGSLLLRKPFRHVRLPPGSCRQLGHHQRGDEKHAQRHAVGRFGNVERMEREHGRAQQRHAEGDRSAPKHRGREDGEQVEHREARGRMRCPTELVVIPGAGHLFEEPGALERVSGLAAEWFGTHL